MLFLALAAGPMINTPENEEPHMWGGEPAITPAELVYSDRGTVSVWDQLYDSQRGNKAWLWTWAN